ncbi:autotransporter outer membrane beta-barrel domain-containing protein [Bradyrhizobium sp. RDI18]|uniref:autotransporter family protein n=1 Tax=Bradyrhizobium sp. RDI18 TaxID=3367400 RepID=UPI003716E9E8
MRHGGARSLLVLSSLVSLALATDARARCVNTTTGGQATDGVDMPTSGQSIVCDPGQPNPSTTTVTSTPGSAGVSVTVLPGAIVTTTVRTIGLNGDASSVLNQGSVNTIGGNNAFGISTSGAGNTLTNAGAITTTGLRGHGMNASGGSSNSTLINTGTINVSGSGASGIRSTDTTTSTTITNSGSITASGLPSTSPAPTLFGNGVSLTAGTFQNLVGGTVTSAQAFGVLGGDSNVAVRNAGTITGGNGTAIRLGNGNNIIEMTAGQLTGAVVTGTGTDQFTWSGGSINGAIGLGAGNDTATLRNLADAQLATTPVIDGAAGIDHLVFDNSAVTGFGRFTNWEAADLINGTRLMLDSSGVRLGDAGTGTGALTIDGSSALLAGNGVNATIQSFTAGQLVTVSNAGIIDLTNGGSVAADTLTIAGNYIGVGGTLRLNTVLGSDGSASDRLAIAGAGASASGATTILVNNAGGGGAATLSDGIAVVQATGGATTAPGSFSLGAPAAAGAFEYMLFRGGLNGANPDNWYLRSALLVPVTPAQPDTVPVPVPLPAPPPPGMTVIELIRPEVAVQTVVPEIARTLGLAVLSTFNERRGDQTLLDNAPAAWGRIFGQSRKQEFSGGVLPSFNGSYGGFQAGLDVLRFDTFDGAVRNFVGFAAARSRATGDVSGFALGVLGAHVGVMDLNATSVAGYWTVVGSTGWYVDTVLQGDFFDGTPHSDRQVGASILGSDFLASVEAGLPVALGPSFAIEPQAQFTYQHLGLDNTRDVFSSIGFAPSDVVNGRVGLRLKGTFGNGATTWMPYLRGDVWWRTSGIDDVAFATNVVSTVRNSGPAAQVSVGIKGRFTEFVSLYGEGSYLTAFDDSLRVYKGNVGLRVTW